ncbi:MAG TPA: GNAT family N-acetyltransferase [Terriglobales bacterium]|nr:GNAT family N-acetyltransferase [Terriglobales bacterium]
MPEQLTIVPAKSAEQLDTVRKLLLEYWENRKLEMYVFNFDQELAGLPGAYAPPNGRLFLAEWENEPAGCVALRKLEPDICEMKRLYLSPKFRGKGIGRVLAEFVVTEARKIGYKRMRLDTIQSNMQEAIALYRQLGFTEIAPYRENPLPGVVFMELAL